MLVAEQEDVVGLEGDGGELHAPRLDVDGLEAEDGRRQPHLPQTLPLAREAHQRVRHGRHRDRLLAAEQAHGLEMLIKQLHLAFAR